MSQFGMILRASLVTGGSAVVFQAHPAHLKLSEDKRLAVMPMQMFRSDCSGKVPGAGMDATSLQPFTAVYKDGYYKVDCVDDDMFLHGDKYGDNKVEYAIGETSNVSIVHYSMHVVKEDRKTMTPDVCFRFCRTVPDMGFFGIRNGNQCYCTPYYRSVEGDDSMCDVVCEGDGTQACGSKTKSTIFGLHSCNNQVEVMGESAAALTGVGADVESLLNQTNETVRGLQTAAVEYQELFGQHGDPVASDMMQTAKVRAGELEKMVVDAAGLHGEIASALAEEATLKTADFTLPAKMTESDELVTHMEGLTADGVAASEDLTRQLESARPKPSSGAEKQYYHAMYFVDKANMNTSTTCGGTASHPPLVGNLSTCAAACDADIHECVGFSYFPYMGRMKQEQGLCFLMSAFKTLTYYTGCTRAAFFDHEEVKCMVKFSKFEGTSLAVDGTGKCKECFREVTHADRCFAS